MKGRSDEREFRGVVYIAEHDAYDECEETLIPSHKERRRNRSFFIGEEHLIEVDLEEYHRSWTIPSCDIPDTHHADGDHPIGSNHGGDIDVICLLHSVRGERKKRLLAIVGLDVGHVE